LHAQAEGFPIRSLAQQEVVSIVCAEELLLQLRQPSLCGRAPQPALNDRSGIMCDLKYAVHELLKDTDTVNTPRDSLDFRRRAGSVQVPPPH
jgi:hypothetical protein